MIGRAHRLSLLSTVALGVAGVMGGSTLLFAGGLALLGVVLVTSGQLLATERSANLQLTVHAVTVVGLAGALAIIGRARIDAVLLIVMLGIFNRYALRGGARDDFIIVAASAVLMTMATTVTPGLAFLPLVVAFVPSALWALVAANALGQDRHAQGPRGSMEHHPVPPLSRALTVGALAFMLLGFVAVSFFPRYNFGRALAAGSLMRFGGVGGSMGMNTGGVSDTNSSEVLLRMETDQPMEGLYARLYVLDAFDGQSWTGSIFERGEKFAGVSAPVESSQWLRVQMRRAEPRGRPQPVAAIGRVAPWAVLLRRPVMLPNGGWLTPLAQATLDLKYRVAPGERPRLPADADMRRFLQLPSGLDPRVRDLARSLTKTASTAAERISAVLGHFDSEYVYSLSALDGASTDPLVRFLLEAKAGHCELYAGATVVLLRLAGVPARVATGFYGGWYNQRSGELEFTSEDAHAWVEVWDGEAWKWVDATPPGVRTRRAGKPLAWLRDYYDWLEGVWYNQVVDYDEQRRQQMLGSLAGGVRQLGVWLKGGPGGAGPRASSGAAALVAVAVMGLVAVVYALRRRAVTVQTVGAELRRALGAEPTETLGAALVRSPLRDRAASIVRRYEQMRFGSERSAGMAALRTEIRALSRASRAMQRVRQGHSAR